MASFPVTSEEVSIKFQCPQCKADIVYDITHIPHPDMGAKNVSKSTVHRDDDIICCHCECNPEFVIKVCRDMYDGHIQVFHNEKELEVSILKHH